MPQLADLLRCHGEALHRSFLIGDGTRASLAACLQPPHQIQEHSDFAGASVILAIADQLRAALALIALDGVARRIVLMPAGEAHQHLDAIRKAAGADHVIEDWPHAAQPAPIPSPTCAPGSRETEWVLLTSGTTGAPKLVVHTLQTLAAHIIGGSRPDRARIWCNFYDTRRYGGLQVLLRALIQNETLVLSCPHQSIRSFLAHASGHGVTHLVGTPSHFRQMLISGAAGMLSPDYVRLSGEIADQAILNRLRSQFPGARIVHAFASTEAGLAFEVADGQAGLPARLATVAMPQVEAEIQGRSLRLRSPFNALGYLDETRAKLTATDGFVETGDLLTLQDGRYQFSGRHSGEVNIGGRKVHPEEVEAVLYEHPAVDLCAVWARKNPITGAVVAADVVCRQPPGPDLAGEILRFCRSRLPSYKVPVSIRFVQNLAISPSGKLVRQHA